MNRYSDIFSFTVTSKITKLILCILKDTIHKILPYNFYRHISNFYFQFLIRKVAAKQKHALVRIKEKFKKKEKINVVFMLVQDSVWKYESVYKIFNSNACFNPVVLVCPFTGASEEIMISEMDRAFNNFYKKGYNVIKALKEDQSWIDVIKELKADIVFFTTPHRLTMDRYYITNFPDTLTCYVQYSFHITHLHSLQYDQLFHNVLWKSFCETPVHLEYASKYSRINGKNTFFTGYPLADVFSNKNYLPENPWKVQDRELFRIIWAPHHTIIGKGSELDYSNFIQLAEEMINLANDFSQKIQIAFKPHPLLKMKLMDESIWGINKTTEYYNIWRDLPNGMLCEADYIDLFITSDGLIHDSASFMTEYAYLNKPALFLVRDEKISERFNDFGKIIFNLHYKGSTREDIIRFLNDVIFEGNDYMKKDRTQFIMKYLIPPNGISASENIFRIITESLIS